MQDSFTKIALIAGLIALTLAGVVLFMLPKRGVDKFVSESVVIESALPAFVIDKAPNTSLHDIQVWAYEPTVVAGDDVIVYFETDAPAYVYLLHIGFEGDQKTVTLVYPNPDDPINFVQEGTVHIPSFYDGGYVQALVTKIPLAIADSVESVSLGNDPMRVKDRILAELARRGLGEVKWDADWLHYTVRAPSMAAPAKDSESESAASDQFSADPPRASTQADSGTAILIVEVVDETQSRCPVDSRTPEAALLHDAHVYIDGGAQSIDLEQLKQGTQSAVHHHAFEPLTLETGWRGLLVTVPMEYEPASLLAWINPRDAYDRDEELISLERGRIVKVCYELRPTPIGTAQFRYLPLDPQPLQDEVSFDASRSRALTYIWNFGDGSSLEMGNADELAQVTHIYKTPGFYTVKLITMFDDRSLGRCPDSGEISAQCEVQHQIVVGDEGGMDREVITSDTPVRLAEVFGCASLIDGACTGIPVMNVQKPLDGPLTSLTFKFDYAFKKFPFTQSEILDGNALDADSAMFVKVSFLDDEGKEAFPNEGWVCTLQTRSEPGNDGCGLRIPIGDAVSGSETLDLTFENDLYKQVINQAIENGLIKQIKVVALATLNIRLNKLELRGGELEVEYSNFELTIE